MADVSNDRDRRGVIEKFMDYLPARFRPGTAVVPVVRLSGVIGAVTPLRPGMTLSGVARVLERAFSTRNAKAVALVINSPGGSPVQSRQIYLRIKQLAAEKKLPVLVFVEDVAASGGYMIACAGDEIFCDPSSILGSIGVVGGSFGFQEAIKRLGIERRLYTSGDHKAMLDPFLPENPDDVARLKAIQREIHAIFIALVKQSRGARLTEADDTLFSGEYWAGDPGDLGKIRVLAAGALRPLVPWRRIAEPNGTRNNVPEAEMKEDRPMPPFVAFAGVLGGLAVVRWAYKTAVRINHELEELRLARVPETAPVGEIRTLKRDPVSGAYRPG
jgi:signal peptide peptidase SppA